MHELFSAMEPAARFGIAVFFNSLWEAGLLALIVWLPLRLFPNLNATTRYAAWCAALIAGVLLPIGTAVPKVIVLQTPAQAGASLAPSAAHAAIAPHRSQTSALASTDGAASSRPAVQRPPDRVRLTIPRFVSVPLFAAWALVALALLVRLGWNLLRLESLKRDALPLGLDYRDRLVRWKCADLGTREIRLCTCEDVEIPVAVGLFDSMILVPRHLVDSLAPEEVDQIVLHELGHLRRGDDWTNGLQRVLQALFFFNPAIQYIAAEMDLEREVACDDWVVGQTKSVRPYASCLTKMAEITAWPHRALQAPGVFVTRRGLSVRIERLLRSGRRIGTSVALAPAGAVAALLIAAFFIVQNVAPSFAFSETQTAQPVPLAQALPTQAPSTKPVVRDRIVTRDKVVTRYRDVFVPPIHVHEPARTITTPAVNVDVPAQRVHVVVPNVNVSRPVAIASPSIANAVSQALSHAMRSVSFAQASSSSSGCTGCQFRGENLSGHSFRGQNLTGTNFEGAVLRNADFTGATLNGVNFANADLRGASFAQARMLGCNLANATFDGATFDGAQMTGCNFDAHRLTADQARWALLGCRSGCNFAGANLRGQDLRGVRLTGTNLSGADLRTTDFSQSELSGVNFNGARMAGARFNGARIVGCTFAGVDLRTVDFTGAEMSGDTMNVVR